MLVWIHFLQLLCCKCPKWKILFLLSFLASIINLVLNNLFIFCSNTPSENPVGLVISPDLELKSILLCDAVLLKSFTKSEYSVSCLVISAIVSTKSDNSDPLSRFLLIKLWGLGIVIIILRAFIKFRQFTFNLSIKFVNTIFKYCTHRYSNYKVWKVY